MGQHSFQEVMKQWKRMCIDADKGPDTLKCGNCRMEKIRLCGFEILDTNDEEIQNAERVIVSWAAEHPEPVYPTWGEWLMSIGVISGLFPKGAIDALGNLKHPIPADIAEKLGIEPKE